MKRKYEMPSIKEVKIELSQCMCITRSGINVEQGSSEHSNVNGSELGDDAWGDVVDITPKNRGSRW